MTAEELAKILDELGQRLGPTGEYVFGLAVKNVWATSLMAAIGGVLGIVAAAIALLIAWRVYSRATKAYDASGDTYRYSRPSAFDYLFPAAMVAVIVGGGGLVFLLTAIPSLLVPEYAALRDLIGAVAR